MTPDTINPPARLLMGPGPIGADPRVLRAMAAPLVGQFDPVMTGYMQQTMSLYRQVFGTTNEATLLIDGTSRAAIEAVLVSLVEPGDTVLVPVMGRFGLLLTEIAGRVGGRVATVERPWGQVFTPEEIEQAILRHRPKVLALVQGDTSTTMNQPLAEIGAICRRHGVLSYVDATASLGGNTFRADDWQIDAASAGLQKCLGGPPGSAPFTLSTEAARMVRARRHIEAGLADGTAPSGVRIGSNYLDLAMVLDYWGPARLNHHTESTSMLYAAHECARLLVAEGIDAAVERHRQHGRAMAAGLAGLGLELYGDQEHRMNNVIGVVIPAGVDGEQVRAGLLGHYGIEIGTSFGPLRGVIWRIGVMGYNARADAVLTTLAALEQELRRAGAPVPAGGGVDAALATYDAEKVTA